MICLGKLAVECTIPVLGLAVLLVIIPINAAKIFRAPQSNGIVRL